VWPLEFTKEMREARRKDMQEHREKFQMAPWVCPEELDTSPWESHRGEGTKGSIFDCKCSNGACMCLPPGWKNAFERNP